MDNMNKFKALLSNTNWTSVYEAFGTDNQYLTFEKVIHELHEECFPLKNVKINPRSDCKPWIFSAIFRSIRKKNNMDKKCLTNTSTEFLAKYKTYKNKLTSIIRQAEKNYFSDKLMQVRDNMAKTWKI